MQAQEAIAIRELSVRMLPSGVGTWPARVPPLWTLAGLLHNSQGVVPVPWLDPGNCFPWKLALNYGIEGTIF